MNISLSTSRFLPHWSRISALALALLALSSAACTSRNAASSGNNRNVIAEAEIDDLRRLNALEIVQRLRPQWLQTRGIDSFQQSNAVIAYLDGARYGQPAALRNVRANDILEIRYLDSRQATMRFGVGHPSGAILVVTRR